MTNIGVYILGILIALVLSLVVVFIIKKRFEKILIELTGSEGRAKFWVMFSNILIVLVTLVFAMNVTPSDNFDVFFQINTQLKWSLIGLIISLVVVGIFMISFIPKGSSSKK